MVKKSDFEAVDCKTIYEYYDLIISKSSEYPEEAEELIRRMAYSQRREFQDHLDIYEAYDQNLIIQVENTLIILENYL
jgi:hypothetical protein